MLVTSCNLVLEMLGKVLIYSQDFVLTQEWSLLALKAKDMPDFL